MIYAVTCADDNYMPSAQFQMETAKKYGKVDRAIIYNLKDIDKQFQENNKQIFLAGGERRKGCYLWKPYFLNKALEQMEINDYMIYLDAAGNYYRSKPLEIINYLEKKGIEIVGSRKYQYLEKHWTKRDAFILMKCDTTEYVNQQQCYAGFLIIKKTQNTMKFMKEWLAFAQNYNVITDAPNICGKENYEGFQEHRFDQSILSILLTKYHAGIMEELPVPEFYYYHHTRELSIKAVKKRKKAERKQQIRKYISNRNVKGIWYLERERLLNSLFVQRMYKKIKK